MSNKITYKKKLISSTEKKGLSRVDDYWIGEVLNNVFGKERATKEKLNGDFKFYDQDWIIKSFGLKSIEYGNWLEQDDRYIYLAGFAYAAKDFCDIHRIPYNRFGKNKLGIAFGSRGRSASLAHYEPINDVINITRHRPKSKIDAVRRFLGQKKLNTKEFKKIKYNSSGAGSLGHEYAHFLDFNIGRKDPTIPVNFASETINIIDKLRNENAYFLNGSIPRRKKTKLVYDIMFALMYKTDDTKIRKSSWYNALEKNIDKAPGMGDYWLLPVEILARSFEVYLYIKCSKKGVKESFLKKKKYDSYLYPSRYFLKQSGAYKLFEKFVNTTAKL